ncbi:uncharacterized protein LOC110986779 [Acanthaster planci]|uniref:Uncharacterized protein LOC110986779 n=1 Tax=Acanthaster planci TaxID=133434 RepID=A0A8B7ZMR8_ACAPL|nr:uncharacterized protein LOC110986779 [Acanthaster planci]
MAFFRLCWLLNFVKLAFTWPSWEVACPYVCECDTSKMIVDCTGVGLTDIPVDVPNRTRYLNLDDNLFTRIEYSSMSRLGPWLRGLSLADNALEEISNINGLSQLRRLERLDLSGNLLLTPPLGGLQQLSSLWRLDLSRNYLMALLEDSFLGLLGLRELYLGENSIQAVQKGAFANLPSLRKLSLVSNSVKADPAGWFTNTPLQELQFSHNRIQLTSGVGEWFGPNGTMNLRFLFLANNGIKFLPLDVFRGLENLEVLDLEGNYLSIIKEYDFKGLGNLKELKLDGNAITDVFAGSFFNVPDLTVLTLSGNRLKSLPLDLLNQAGVLASQSYASNKPSHNEEMGVFQELEELYMSISEFSDLVDRNHLNPLRELKTLSLGHNRLQRAPEFWNLTSMQVVDLSFNQITRIDGDTFAHNAQLQEIYLDHNDLVYLDQEMFEGLQFLETLTLSGNSWWCDCRLLWMQDLMWLEEQPLWAVNLGEEVACSYPPYLNGIRLMEVGVQTLQDQCISLNDGLVLPAVISVWFVLIVLVVARVWFRRYLAVRKFSQDKKSNFRYERKRKLRRRRHGITGDQSYSLSAKFGQRRLSFPLQRPVRSYRDVTVKPDVYTEQTEDNKTMAETLLSMLVKSEHMRNKLPDLSVLLGKLRKLSCTARSILHQCLNMVVRVLVSLLVAADFTGLLLRGQSAKVCPADCECDADKMLVDCTDRGLLQIPVEGMPNRTRILVLDGNFVNEVSDGTIVRLGPWLRRLSMAGNNLERFPNGSFSRLWRLKALDLSDNHISDVAPIAVLSLRQLILSQNDLEQLNASTFRRLSLLRELYLDQNTIWSIHEGTFRNLPSLMKLSLKDNLLTDDPVGWFTQTPLEELHLSYNRIPLTSGIRGWFGENATLNLKLLFLESNGIKFLPKDVFAGLQTLEVLNLNGNRLTVVNKHDFSGLTGLQELQLNDNDLMEIHEESLIQTPSLLFLTVDRNRLKNLTLRPTGSITTLSVASNRLQNIAGLTNGAVVESLLDLTLTSNHLEDIFGLNSLPALLSLRLDYNRVQRVPEFQNLTSLQNVDLSFNEIKGMDGNTFKHNTQLQEIYLDHNDLVYLDQELFEGLQFLETLTLSGNSWWCDCRLLWMQDLMWLEEQPQWAVNLAQDIICTQPESLKGEPLQYVSKRGLERQCPVFQLGVILPAGLGLWFLILGFLIARYWVRQYISSRKFARRVRSIVNYGRGLQRRRKLGVSKWPSHVLPLSTKFDLKHRWVSFPLHRKGRMYLDINASYLRHEDSVCGVFDNDTYSAAFDNDTHSDVFKNGTHSETSMGTAMKGFSLLLQILSLGFVCIMLQTAKCHPFLCLDAVYLCDCDATKLSIDCSDLGFRTVPLTDISNVTSSLDFGGNLLTAILQDTLRTLGELLRLSLENNQITYVESGSFSVTRELRFLDLSGNKLSVIPSALNVLTSLKVLNFSNNELSSLSSDDFESFTKLDTLRLENNRLDSISNTTFHPLANLELLYIDHNFISADPIGWFTNSTRLAYLRMSHNQIPLTANVEVWFGVAQETLPLEELHLDNNAIQQISEVTFRSCENLKELNLSENEIASIAPGSFFDLTRLQELALDGNELSDIPDSLFLDTEALLVLSLQDNSLSVLSRNVFAGLGQAVQLNLAGNGLTTLGLFASSNGADSPFLPALTSLYLNSNVLSEIPDVHNFSNLEILDLSHNIIFEMEPYAFNGTSLRQLHLHDNLLTTMSLENFQFLPALQSVTVTDNPWICDCRMFWLVDPEGEALAWKSALYNDVFCKSPDFAANLDLRTLHLREQTTNGRSGPFSPCETANWLIIVIIVVVWVLIFLLVLVCYLSHSMNYEKGYVSRTIKTKVVRATSQPAEASAPLSPSPACLNEGATFDELDKCTITNATYEMTARDEGGSELPEIEQLEVKGQVTRKESIGTTVTVTLTSAV